MIDDAEVRETLLRLTDLPMWEDGITDLEQPGFDGDTPLHAFCWRSDIEGVSCLLRAGAQVDARGDMGFTPLMVAATTGSIATVRLLLDSGADRLLVNEFGSTALQSARRQETSAPREEREARKEVVNMLSRKSRA